MLSIDFGAHAVFVLGLLHLCTFMLWLTFRSEPTLIQVKPLMVAKFALAVIGGNLLRHLVFGSAPQPMLAEFPLGVVMSAWWEDVAHTLPAIALLAAYPGNRKAQALAGLFILVSSLSFAAGHVYEGWGTVALFTLYVPLLSFRYGRRHGLGTVMGCHVAWDLITILACRMVT